LFSKSTSVLCLSWHLVFKLLVCSDVNKDLRLKAKDFGHKAKAKDLGPKAKAKDSRCQHQIFPGSFYIIFNVHVL